MHRRGVIAGEAQTRRAFLRASVAGLVAAGGAVRPVRAAPDAEGPGYTLSLDTPTRLFDGRRCWVHARAGIVPGAGKDGNPRVVMTMNLKDLSGSDLFDAMYGMHSDDLGATWTQPTPIAALGQRTLSVDGRDGVQVGASDFTPAWHGASGVLLGTGHTVKYHDGHLLRPRPRHTVYATYDPAQDAWRPWQRLAMPPEDRFYNMGAGSTQRLDLPDGDILLPLYGVGRGDTARVFVVRCNFDGTSLSYAACGEGLSIEDDTRGLHEPSLTQFDGRYLLTIRNDAQGFVTHSDDGLHFAPIRPWRFDDGSDLGNYNTQQHWVTHSDALYLVYTRRGANNDHVFRHRAPLFMAQVDPGRLCVLRETERVLVPERGARLGNFGVADISPTETWVIAAEWMQPAGVEQHGSDGTVFVARIHWERPNRLFRA